MEQKELGAKIKELRKEHKDTLKSLALKIDYDWSNLSKVERGIYGASVELLRKITEVYNVNPKYFFDGLTESEGHLLREENNDPSVLKEKYHFVDEDGQEVSEEELLEALKLIRFLKQQK